jgi:AcrR family transcriptional regulator
MQSYLRLVRQKPLDKLTVKDIVEDCEITRNTFYYHFQDIYDLTAEVFRSEFAALLRSGGADIGWWDMVREAAGFAQKNRAAAYVTDGGVRLHVKDDRYIRTTESRVKIQNAQPRGGGKGPGPGGI